MAFNYRDEERRLPVDIKKKKLGAFNIPFYPIQDLIKWMIDVTYNPHCHRGKTVVVWIWIGN